MNVSAGHSRSFLQGQKRQENKCVWQHNGLPSTKTMHAHPS